MQHDGPAPPTPSPWARRLDVALDVCLLAPFVAGAGIVIGAVWGWPVGVGVAAGITTLLWGVQRAAGAIIRKSLQTRVPQRRFPRR